MSDSKAILEGLASVLPALIQWAGNRLIAGDKAEDLTTFLEEMHKQVEINRGNIDGKVDLKYPPK